jgi:hypothetical protein
MSKYESTGNEDPGVRGNSENGRLILLTRESYSQVNLGTAPDNLIT